MKAKWLFICIVILVISGASCKKSDTSTSNNATMSATVNGSPVTFANITITKQNGLTVVQGTGGGYTLTLVLANMGPSVFTLGAQSTNYYATIANNTGYSYSTDAANVGQITTSQSGNLYNATFYFNASETAPTQGGGNIAVTSGSCGNI